MVIVLQLGLLIFALYIIYLLIYTLALGAPYAPLANERIQAMIKLLELKKGQKVADIGSGDGRIVMAFAKKGIEAHGYEINPLLVWISRYRIKKAHLENKAFIHWKDFWIQNVSNFDAFTLYGIKHMMPNLEKKFRKELKPGTKVVSNYFQFPNWKPVKTESRVHLYIQNQPNVKA